MGSTTHGMLCFVAINTLRPRQNGRHFADDIFKCIFLNENAGISLKISLKFSHKVQINNIPALVQKMAWRRPGDKPLSEPMMVSLLTHICVTRPQWVNQPLMLLYKDHAITPHMATSSFSDCKKCYCWWCSLSLLWRLMKFMCGGHIIAGK